MPKADNPYLVALYCHECGCRMYGEWVTISRLLKCGCRKDYNEYGIYVCIGRKKEPRCTHQQRIDNIHSMVFEELRNIVYNPEVTTTLIEERTKRMTSNTGELNDRIDSKKQAIKDKEAF